MMSFCDFDLLFSKSLLELHIVVVVVDLFMAL